MATSHEPIDNARDDVRASAIGDQMLYSVGRLAGETGISPGTLRVWERRYGNPAPLRLPSGHRRYTEAQLRYLRRVAEGLARGLRPSALLTLPEEELEAILTTAEDDGPSRARRRRWVAAVRKLEPTALTALFEREASCRPTLDFLEGFLAPFLTEIGRAWAEGELDIRHEHFATSIVEDQLRLRRREIAEHNRGLREPYRGLALLATLPAERHTLGLLMTALLVEEARLQPNLLGADTPVTEIARAVAETGATMLAVSVSLSGGGPEADRRLGELRRLLSARVALVVGGAGARRGRRGPRGIVAFDSFSELAAWLRAFHP